MPFIHLSRILINSLTYIHILISSSLLAHTCFHLLYTLLSFIQYFLFKCLKLAPIMESDPYRPILLIVRTVQFLDISAILIYLVHLFSKKEFRVHYPSNMGQHVIMCSPWNMPYSIYCYSPSNI